MEREEFGTGGGQAYMGDGGATATAGNSMMDQAGDIASKAQETATEKAEELKDKAGEVRSQAGEKMLAGADAGKERAASGLSMAADRMRERAESHDGMQADVAARAADAMDRTAGYLKEHDSQELWADMEQFVKDHPMQAAAGALFAGYVLGKLMR
ncbi:MAG: hypothetical protein IT302_09595 [Dehalococcoidia bacterium]|nr:hypothetical protein [Dehalococcoidia bacterium]